MFSCAVTASLFSHRQNTCFLMMWLSFYRYLTVETGESHTEKDERIKEMYYTVFKRFSKALVKVRTKNLF